MSEATPGRPGAGRGDFKAGNGSLSVVQATFSAALVGLRGRGFAVPPFKGELETRIQPDVLRLAGRFRSGWRWRDDRIKIPLPAFVHARVQGSRVHLWLRPQSAPAHAAPQWMTLELFNADAAEEFVRWLPGATPPPPTLVPHGGGTSGHTFLIWIAVIGVAAVLILTGVVIAVRVH